MTYNILREGKVKYSKPKRKESVFFKLPEDIFNWFRRLEDETQEKFITVYLTKANEVICYQIDFVGGLDHCMIDQRIILRNALLNNATALVILHNHPSGNTEPSTEDLTLTRVLIKAAETVGIRLIDHVIIGGRGFHSMRESSGVSF